MDKSARMENIACVAVVEEMRAWLQQEGAPEVATKLLTEAATRIELRRIRARLDDHKERSEAPDGGGA